MQVEATPGPGHVYEMLEGQAEPGVWQEVKGRKVESDLQRLMDSTAEFDSTDEDSTAEFESTNEDSTAEFDSTDEEDEAGLQVDSDSSRGDFYQLEFRQHKRCILETY